MAGFDRWVQLGAGVNKHIPIPISDTLVLSNGEFSVGFSELYERCPETVVFEHRLTLLHLMRLSEYLRAFRLYSGKQLYEWFLERYPGLTNRIKDKYLASFLGITAQSLSRIRGVRD